LDQLPDIGRAGAGRASGKGVRSEISLDPIDRIIIKGIPQPDILGQPFLMKLFAARQHGLAQRHAH
jgi:hypothetical protein